MIERILPASVVVVEAWRDELDAELFPEEEIALGRAVDKRRREFTTARACARAALARLGIAPVPIPVGERGEPRWPAGVVGSITHCDGYRACAVARSETIVTLGVDAEPNGPLPAGLLDDIARPEELACLARLRRDAGEVHWDRLLFSAKEAVYKAWFPLARRWLGFEDAVLTIDRPADAGTAGRFAVRLLVAAPKADGRAMGRFCGSWIVEDGIIATSVAIGRGGALQPRAATAALPAQALVTEDKGGSLT